MNVPCATSHSNASKLDAVFVDQLVLCTVFVGVKGREEKSEWKGSKKKEEKEKEQEQEQE